MMIFVRLVRIKDWNSKKKEKEFNQGRTYWRSSLKSGPHLNLFGSFESSRAKGYLPESYFIWVSVWKLDVIEMKILLLAFICSNNFSQPKGKPYIVQNIYSFLKLMSFYWALSLKPILTSLSHNVSCLFIDSKC
jgi:hypothetical protein